MNVDMIVKVTKPEKTRLSSSLLFFAAAISRIPTVWIPNVEKIKKISIKKDSRGYKIIVTIDVPFGTQLTGKVHKLQQYIIDKIETLTGILIEEVSIVIDKITKVETPPVEEEKKQNMDFLKQTLARFHIDKTVPDNKN